MFYMTNIQAQSIIDQLYAEAKDGDLSQADYIVYDYGSGGFPYNLFLISSDKQYAAKLYLKPNPEDSGFVNYGFSDSRNAFTGVDIYSNVELYYNENGIQTFNAGTVYSGTNTWEGVEIEPNYEIAVPTGINDYRFHGASDSQGYIATNESYLILENALPNNISADSTAPTFLSAATSTDGTQIVLTYNEALSSTAASTSDFDITTGGVSNSVTEVTTSGSTVELTLTTPAKNNETVTVAYTDPSSNDDTNAVQDSAGNDVATLSSTIVTNNSTVTSGSSSTPSTFSTTRDNIKVETSEGTYYIIKEAKTFSDAKTAAEEDNGRLASFETENEYTLLYNAIAKEYESDSSWGANSVGAGGGVYLRIGGTDGDTVSRYDSETWNWKWISDDSEISKSRTEWGEGTEGQEPDNYFDGTNGSDLGGQDSLVMGLTGWGGSSRNKYGDAGEWNDVRDDSSLYYLVEVSEDTTTDFTSTDTTSTNSTTEDTSTETSSGDSDSTTETPVVQVATVNTDYTPDTKGFASITGSTPVKVTAYEIGQETKLDSIKDYDGNLHAGDNLEETASSYKYQGMLDVNGDGTFEAIFTNKVSKRWVTAKIDSVTGQVDFDDNGASGGTRVVGIYEDPLIAEGADNGGFLSDGVTPAPANFGVSEEERYVEVNGETIDRLALNSQVRFQNDLDIDNLQAKHSGDYDSDGVSEVYWKTADGTAYLRALMHADGNIRYANYQSEAQMSEYLTAQAGEENSAVANEIIASIIG